MTRPNLRLILEFGSGAEKLVGNVKKRELLLDGTRPWSLGQLIIYISDNLVTERPELFTQNGDLRPGILVLVNDTDWELLGQQTYILQPNDNVMFISTLHGG